MAQPMWLSPGPMTSWQHDMSVATGELVAVDKFGFETLLSDGDDGVVDGHVTVTLGPSPLYLRFAAGCCEVTISPAPSRHSCDMSRRPETRRCQRVEVPFLKQRLKNAARRISGLELGIVVLGIAPVLIFDSWMPRWAIGLALVLIPCLWLVRWFGRGHLTRPTPLDVPILLLLFMVLVGIWAAAIKTATLPEVYRIVLGVALFYAMVNTLITARHLRLVTALVLAATAALGVLALLGMRLGAWQVPPAAAGCGLCSLALYRSPFLESGGIWQQHDGRDSGHAAALAHRLCGGGASLAAEGGFWGGCAGRLPGCVAISIAGGHHWLAAGYPGHGGGPKPLVPDCRPLRRSGWSAADWNDGDRSHQ